MANIQVEIEGIIAVLFERDPSPPHRPTACVLGIVKNVPGHQLDIKFKKNSDPEVVVAHSGVERLTLTVAGTPTPGIRFFNEQVINRVTVQTTDASGNPKPADQTSASWLLEFEGELYPADPPIGVIPTRFHPIFRINDGEIFTMKISDNHLLTRFENAPADDPYTLVGRVATKVGIRSNLAGSTATLANDLANLVDVAQRDSLKITVALTCPSCTHTGQQTGHANHYYRAIGTNLPFGERLLFSSTKMVDSGGPISPEASCLVGQVGMSNPNGN
jgi:hypothetical protein